MKKLKQLRKEEIKIRAEIGKIEEEEIAKFQIPRLKKMVGQCFVYRDNSYGKDTDNWDVFKKILDWVDGEKDWGFHFVTEEFSIDCYGKISWIIENDHPYVNREWWGAESPFSGYKKITEKEYNAEKVKMIEEMGSQKTMRKVLNSKYV